MILYACSYFIMSDRFEFICDCTLHFVVIIYFFRKKHSSWFLQYGSHLDPPDWLSKRALVVWFNFDLMRKCFYTGHLSDYPCIGLSMGNASFLTHTQTKLGSYIIGNYGLSTRPGEVDLLFRISTHLISDWPSQMSLSPSIPWHNHF